MIPAADLAAIYAQSDAFAETATFGAHTARVFLRSGDEDAMGGERLVRGWRIRYIAAQLPGLQRGSTLTVDGQSYRVLEVRALDHGAESSARLERL
jgi:hypothetical protein